MAAQGVTLVLSPPVQFILKQTGRFRRHLLDLGPLWDRFEKTMESIQGERFETEGYGQWPELAWSTQIQRYALGFPSGGPILVRTGELRDSIVDPNLASITTRTQMEWSTDVPYAHWHQDGGTIAGRPPQRKILDIRTEDRRRLESDMVSWINDMAARTFGRI